MPSYVHNPYLDGGAYGNTVDANRVGTSALTIGLNPPGTAQIPSTIQPIMSGAGNLGNTLGIGTSSGNVGNGSGGGGGGGGAGGNRTLTR